MYKVARSFATLGRVAAPRSYGQQATSRTVFSNSNTSIWKSACKYFSTVHTTDVKSSHELKATFDFQTLLANPEKMRENLRLRKAPGDVDKVLSLLDKTQTLRAESITLRERRNKIADDMKFNRVSAEEKPKYIEEGKHIKAKLSAIDTALGEVEAQLQRECLVLPNFFHPDIPMPENGPRKLLEVGKKPEFGFEPKSHLELGSSLDLLHFPVQSGAHKTYYSRNDGAMLELALVNYAMSTVANKYGFTPIMTPDIVFSSLAEACGFQPRGDHTQVYSIKNDDLVLVGTQEIPLAALYHNKTVNEEELPIKMVAFGHCFRAEAGSGGAENKGLYRVHQFSKVEMFVLCHPDKSEAMHQELLNIELELLTSLGLHFQVLDMPSDDLGASAYRKFDIEAWMPSRNGYGEVTSASNCTDYQSRRLGAKFKNTKSGDKAKFVHTLNATAVAIPRVTLAILENFQQSDGTVRIPEPLVPFMGGKTVITPRTPESS